MKWFTNLFNNRYVVKIEMECVSMIIETKAKSEEQAIAKVKRICVGDTSNYKYTIINK